MKLRWGIFGLPSVWACISKANEKGGRSIRLSEHFHQFSKLCHTSKKSQLYETDPTINSRVLFTSGSVGIHICHHISHKRIPCIPGGRLERLFLQIPAWKIWRIILQSIYPSSASGFREKSMQSPYYMHLQIYVLSSCQIN